MPLEMKPVPSCCEKQWNATGASRNDESPWTSAHQRFSLTVEVRQSVQFTQWVVCCVWADLNLPGPLADREAAAPLLDKTRQQSSRLDWYAPPLDSAAVQVLRSTYFCRSEAPKDTRQAQSAS